MERSLLKLPTAWVPIAMSGSALALVIVKLSVFGFARESDEGGAAHLFQLLIAGQLLFIAFFVVKWLPKNPSRGFVVLALQVCAVLAAVAPVFILKL